MDNICKIPIPKSKIKNVMRQFSPAYNKMKVGGELSPRDIPRLKWPTNVAAVKQLNLAKPSASQNLRSRISRNITNALVSSRSNGSDPNFNRSPKGSTHSKEGDAKLFKSKVTAMQQATPVRSMAIQSAPRTTKAQEMRASYLRELSCKALPRPPVVTAVVSKTGMKVESISMRNKKPLMKSIQAARKAGDATKQKSKTSVKSVKNNIKGRKSPPLKPSPLTKERPKIIAAEFNNTRTIRCEKMTNAAKLAEKTREIQAATEDMTEEQRMQDFKKRIEMLRETNEAAKKDITRLLQLNSEKRKLVSNHRRGRKDPVLDDKVISGVIEQYEINKSLRSGSGAGDYLSNSITL